MVSRRQLLSAASAAGAGAALAGCGSTTATGLPGDVLGADVHTLNEVIQAENYAVAAYVAGIPLLSGTDSMIAKQFLEQDLSHIEDLADIVRKAGAKPSVSGQVYDLGHPSSRTEVLELLHHVEQVTLRAYLAAIPKLSPGVVKATAASLFANDAQHASTIRGRLGLAPVPEAVVTGRT
jgi:nucleoside-diphosphate-sugar epimerase